MITIAATRLIAMHINKGKTVAQCLADRTDYSQNEKKTEDGKYISAYACDPRTCDEEFLLTKREYEHRTGRHQAHDVIAYQIRQSFKPGEVAPEEANQIGYETAMRWTKGKYAFIVATHVDKAHVHNHIIYNSTALDAGHKFNNFFYSGLAVARLSDLICLEHNLSVIERRPCSQREKRTDYPERVSYREEICAAIDEALQQKPKTFREMISVLEAAGYEYKSGKHPALKGPDQKRFIRFRSMGEGYSVEELNAVILGNAEHRSRPKTKTRSRQQHTDSRMSFVIDIQKKMSEGKGRGYEIWATNFNLKQRAEALLFMQEHNINSYEELCERADSIAAHRAQLIESVNADEARLKEISVLKTHLINFSKAVPYFEEYKKSGYSRRYFEEHRDILTLRRAAKQAFDEYKKQHPEAKTLPKVKELNVEYTEVLTRKKANYQEYRSLKKEERDWQLAKALIGGILHAEQEENELRRHQQEQEKSH